MQADDRPGGGLCGRERNRVATPRPKRPTRHRHPVPRRHPPVRRRAKDSLLSPSAAGKALGAVFSAPSPVLQGSWRRRALLGLLDLLDLFRDIHCPEGGNNRNHWKQPLPEFLPAHAVFEDQDDRKSKEGHRR